MNLVNSSSPFHPSRILETQKPSCCIPGDSLQLSKRNCVLDRAVPCKKSSIISSHVARYCEGLSPDYIILFNRLDLPGVITNVFCGCATTFVEVRSLPTKQKAGESQSSLQGPRYYSVGRDSCGELGIGRIIETVEKFTEIDAFQGIDVCSKNRLTGRLLFMTSLLCCLH